MCNSRSCPWRRRVGGACCFCNEDRRGIRPRLECDFFNHFLKKSRFRVRRVRAGHELVTLYMDEQISYLSNDMITFTEALGFLSAFKSVGLVTDHEYFDYWRLIFHLVLK